jgi:hypothetical protein
MFTSRLIIFMLVISPLAFAKLIFAQIPDANVIDGKYLRSMQTAFVDDK